MSDESHFLHKEACPKCGSRDNLARYSDGHGYCFGCEHWEPGEGQDESHRPARRKPMSAGLIHGEVRALVKRGITAATCQHFGYMVGAVEEDYGTFGGYARVRVTGHPEHGVITYPAFLVVPRISLEVI